MKGILALAILLFPIVALAQTGCVNIYPCPITQGGTSATSAPSALTNLGALPLAGGAMTGALTASPVNATYVVDGTHYATVQAAMAALQTASPTGGDVWIPCGTFTGPPASSFFNGVHLRSSCGTPTYSDMGLATRVPGGTINTTVLTYSSGLTITDVAGIGLEKIGITFTAGSGGLVLYGVQNSIFDDLTVHCYDQTSNCLTLQGDSTNNSPNGYGTGGNIFKGKTFIYGGLYGIDFTGSSSMTGSVATINDFDYVEIFATGNSSGAGGISDGGAILFDKYCDSNHIKEAHYIENLAKTNGVVFNSSSSASEDVGWEKIDWYDETYYGGAYNRGTVNEYYALVFNVSTVFGQNAGNEITTGVLASNLSGQFASLSSNSFPIWHDASDSYIASGSYAGPTEDIYNLTLRGEVLGNALFGAGVTVDGGTLFNPSSGNPMWTAIPTDDSDSTPGIYIRNHANSATELSYLDDGVLLTNAFGAQNIYTGSTLPWSCNVYNLGRMAIISDASSPTYMGAYVSGGTITADVLCSSNGTTYQWVTH
jgi:hypothetical protein